MFTESNLYRYSFTSSISKLLFSSYNTSINLSRHNLRILELVFYFQNILNFKTTNFL